MTNEIQIGLTPKLPENWKENWKERESRNPNNFSYWFPKLKENLKGEAFILPKTLIVDLPAEFVGCTLEEEEGDFDKLMNWIIRTQLTEKVQQEFGNECFLKNGCYSGKFQFNKTCYIKDISAKSIYNHWKHIEEDSLCLDTCGNFEMIFREYIRAHCSLGKMYDGMPIRPELRVFYNFDNHKILYSVNYWDWDYCSKSLLDEDYDALEKASRDLQFVFANRHEFIENLLEFALQKVPLTGQWSIDVMIEGSNFYIIDMALARQSAYWNPKLIRND